MQPTAPIEIRIIVDHTVSNTSPMIMKMMKYVNLSSRATRGLSLNTWYHRNPNARIMTNAK